MKSIMCFNDLKVYLTFISFLFLISCNKETTSPVEQVVATDYSIASHWLSIPATLYPVDIFYYYPSSWKKLNASDPIICEIDNPLMLQTAPMQIPQ